MVESYISEPIYVRLKEKMEAALMEKEEIIVRFENQVNINHKLL
jgi:hypothetical protein